MSSYLNVKQVEVLVRNNLYIPEEKISWQSRCFCGSYKNSPNLPALSLPGGELGELAIFLSSSLVYGFEIDYKSLVDNLIKHTGSRSLSQNISSLGHSPDTCPYLKSLLLTPKKYDIDSKAKEQLIEVFNDSGIQIDNLINNRPGDNYNKAFLIVQGSKGIFPKYTFDSELGSFTTSVFVYHKGFVDNRHKLLCQQLVSGKSVKLYKGLSDEYLYEVVSEMTDTHCFEAIRQIDPLLPWFSVNVDNKDKISIVQLH